MEPKQQKAPVRIGVDLDGVVTTNPLRLARPVIAWVKHRLLKIKHLSFFHPENQWQRAIYLAGVVWPSCVPAKGVARLKRMAQRNQKYEMYLITGRFGFVEEQTAAWLKLNRLDRAFSRIIINRKDEQPHEFKIRTISECRLDYYIEDNWDIVGKLAGKCRAEIYWITNLLDRDRAYRLKFSNLDKALADIERRV